MVLRLSLSQFKLVALIFIGSMLIGCQDTIPNRGLIKDAQIGEPPSDTDKGPSRPDKAVKFKTDFCGCKDKVAITYGNCSSFCSDKDTKGAGILFVNFNVTEDISLNSKFRDLNGWCNNPLPDVETNPRCEMRARDENSNEIALDVTKGTKINSLQVNIDRLMEDRAWVLTLVEISSGSKSDSVQTIRYSIDIPLTTLGPLKNAPVNQYTCLDRSIAEDTRISAAFKIHFYFLPRFPPDPMPADSARVCHDFQKYPGFDDILNPRFELITGIFNLWDNMDPRFYDNNGNGNADVNDIIIQKAKNFGSGTIQPSTRFFEKFPVITTEEENGEAGSTASSAMSMGYYMFPWVDVSTSRSYCLNSTHYNSANPLFKAMRDVVGVDMEGLYIGTRGPENVRLGSGEVVTSDNDVLLIRETDLKSAWFYLKNNVPTVPTDAIVSSVAVYFYYPLNPAAPFVKSDTQKRYQVKGAAELAGTVTPGGQNPTGVTSNVPPHDRKIGCIPKF